MPQIPTVFLSSGPPARLERSAVSSMDAAVAAKLAEAAPVFAALGDRTRLHIVTRLCEDGPQSIVQLAHGSTVSRQAVTKHLRVLEQAGLARSSRAGRESIWRLRRKRLSKAHRYLDRISRDWDAALDRLRAKRDEAADSDAFRPR